MSRPAHRRQSRHFGAQDRPSCGSRPAGPRRQIRASPSRDQTAAALAVVTNRGRSGPVRVAEGVHLATVLGWFTDSLGFATYHPGPGE
jgi:hypothetical protein